ncbi:MAG: AMP-binding protein [Candidatus Cardinium sp.]|nr:AMP-binding protein [Candidatus Cardinium sp.]
MINTPGIKQNPSSVPCNINVTKYRSFIHLMEDMVARYGNLPMCENMGKILTFRTVDKLSKIFAAYLQQYTSLKVGATVAIQLPNLLQYPIVLLGMLRAGLVVVNINPQYTSHEMLHQLKDAKAQAIIVLENFAHKLAEILPDTAIQTVIITKVGDMLGAFKGKILNFIIKYIKKLVPAYHLPGAVSFKQALAKGKKVVFLPVDLQASDTALLQYTGGTTGVAKGAVLSHGNLTTNIQQVAATLGFVLKEKKERVIIPLPLYHIFGLSSLFTMAQLGARCLLITNPRDIHRLIKEWLAYQPTCLIGVNTLFTKLLADKKFGALCFHTFKYTFSGGMQTYETVKKQWEDLTNSKLIEGYGLTECAPAVASNMHNGTHYIPLPNTHVRIATAEGKAAPSGTAGELLVKGPQVTRAYWNKPSETEETFVDGWLRTGDIAIMDEKGFILVDRKKDMVNISGFNVYPNEIEQVLMGHPKVLEVGAIGVADISLKEAIKVFIVKKDATLTAEEIIAYCKERMTRYKIPKYIEFCKTLPKSNIGKVLRKLLKQYQKEKV